MKDYECHVTIKLPKEQPTWFIAGIRERVEALQWSFSCIQGDPELGDSTFAYATNHYPDADIAIRMCDAVAKVLVGLGMEVVRRKVEHVIYDSRRA
jgi:hypothetical protein